MAEQPALHRIHVIGYSANDRDFPLLALVADPRVAGYQVPKDLSACPDKRYPNHVFTGAQPLSGDERVRHVWEILPSPTVPFTRYDDDLGPVQGRRRSVKNEGQVASLSSETRTTYEAREGSAIVYTELEETWSIKTDEDGNSLFPIRDRDFYDASRGAVQERRQLFVPTGEEEGSLENINGVITQTSYEPYNEFLSVKVVQTYKVDGPQLIGKATDNEGQLTTITTQRKGAKDYNPPTLTATRTVEVAREDAESLVERIIDTPKVFSGKTFSIERPDPVPEKFRVLIPTRIEQETLAGTAATPALNLPNQLAKSEQQVTEFVKRVSTTLRDNPSEQTLRGLQFTSEMGGGMARVDETFPFEGGDFNTVQFGTIADEVENLGNGQRLRRTVKLTPTSSSLNFGDDQPPITAQTLPLLRGQEYDEALDIVIPFQQVTVPPQNTQLSTGSRRRVTPRDVAHSTVVKYDVEDVQDALDNYYWELPEMVQISLPDKLISISCPTERSGGSGNGNGGGDTWFVNYSSNVTLRGKIIYDIEEGFRGNIPALRAIFFLPKNDCSPQRVLQVVREKSAPPPITPPIPPSLVPNPQQIEFYPNVRPQAHELVVFGESSSQETSQSVSFDSASNSNSQSGSFTIDTTIIPPTIHGALIIRDDVSATEENQIGSALTPEFLSGGGSGSTTTTSSIGASAYVRPNSLPATTPYPVFPTGKFIYQINSAPYRFSYVRVEAVILEITPEYV
jgi:hypothetical protein